MECFVTNVPEDFTQDNVRDLIRPHLLALDIAIFSFKFKKTHHSNTNGLLLLPTRAEGARFLAKHGLSRGSSKSSCPIYPRPYDRNSPSRPLRFTPSKDFIDAFALARLIKAAHDHSSDAQALTPTTQANSRQHFLVRSLDCGIWEYQNRSLSFFRAFRGQHAGSILFGRKEMSIVLEVDPRQQTSVQVLVRYHTVVRVVTDALSANVTFTLTQPPKFHFVCRPDSADKKVSRICKIDNDHAAAVGSCLVYRLWLHDRAQTVAIQKRLNTIHGAPTVSATPTSMGQYPVQSSLQLFSHRLLQSGLAFSVLFQLTMLAYNGILPPYRIIRLLPEVRKLKDQVSDDALVEGIRNLGYVLPFPGPKTSPKHFETSAMAAVVNQKASKFDRRGTMYDVARRHEHMCIIHKVCVTPCGVYLEGPELEVKNRVLRKYKDHMDRFIRVEFVDEDGQRLQFESGVDRDPVFEKYAHILENGIDIAGRHFEYLGFSHSSLRSQQTWFMSPFWQDELMFSSMVIKRLGDFSSIRSPAKCAARIGQAFSDATDTIALRPENVKVIKDVERNERVFTDGVGMISKQQMREVWKRFSRSKKSSASILQIRHRGAKGLLALNTCLPGRQILLRESMTKFKGSKDDMNLEITGAGHKTLPMFLNRQFINILEALGASSQAILDLQAAAVQQLILVTESPVNAATYLEHNHFATTPRLPMLIRLLDDIGLDYRQDPFLMTSVELATRVQLRNLKHRGRIPVDDAYLLLGVTDEGGRLGEGQVYVAIKNDRGSTFWHQGRVLITRAPALHPGDFQFAEAVVPEGYRGNPTLDLHNCVVFSQQGHRDLPSQLSGGDLDGDLYYVIYDERLFPQWTYKAADYPRLAPVEKDGPVETKDMTDWFIQFYKQDNLGHICNIHMQVADQISRRSAFEQWSGSPVLVGDGTAGREFVDVLHYLPPEKSGILSPQCITLAKFASKAVDFSKTGNPVTYKDIQQVDGFDRNLKPDFMANAPNLVLDPQNNLDFHDENLEDDTPDAVSQLRNPGRGAVRYYESPMLLGHLYRAIDEDNFAKDFRFRSILPGDQPLLLLRLKAYVERQAAGLMWRHFSDLAKQIRSNYDQALVNTAWKFSPHPDRPLSESEVFCGTILGRNGGIPSRPTRESNFDMKDEFNTQVSDTVEWILRGEDFNTEDVEDGGDEGSALDGLENNMSRHLTIGEEADPFWTSQRLERCIACFMVPFDKREPGESFRMMGHIKSFQYIAAALCLRELKEFHGGRLAVMEETLN